MNLDIKQNLLFILIYVFSFHFIVACVVIILLFRYSADIVVWFVLIVVVFVCIVGMVLLWHHYFLETAADHQSDIGKRRTTTLLVLAIIATIVTFGVLLMIFVLRKRIQLVIRLFKEAGKVVSKMPLLLFEPILVRIVAVQNISPPHQVLNQINLFDFLFPIDARIFGNYHNDVVVLFRYD